MQPVRRLGVDAAVLFADIVSPVLGMGVDVELVEGVGPVVDEPIDSAAAVERLRVAEAEEWAAPILEAVRLVRGELEPERALVGFCGGAVHGGGLPRRGQAEPRLRSHEDAHVPRAGDVARADGAADGAVHAVRRRAGCGGRRRDPALRLLGRCPLRRPTTASSSLRTRPACSPPRAFRRSISVPARRRSCSPRWPPPARRGRRRLAHRARRRLDRGGRRAGDPGESRAGVAARPVGAGRSGRRSTSCAAPAAGRATSSTSVTASCRRPIRMC